jgi:hypothetical protein
MDLLTPKEIKTSMVGLSVNFKYIKKNPRKKKLKIPKTQNTQRI